MSDQREFMSTLIADGDRSWNARVAVVRPRGRKGGVKDLLELLRAANGRSAIILQGSVAMSDRYRDLILAVLLKARKPRPLIFITDSTWEPFSRSLSNRFPFLSRIIPSLAHLAIKLLDGDHVVYGVLSHEEESSFPRIWSVAPDRVVRTGFQHSLYGEALELPTADGGYLFAGGNSLRDYGLLEEAVRGAPWPIIVASSWTSDAPELSCRATSPDEFLSLMAGARACVVPLQTASRSAGQQTYLNSMALGKPTVVTDAVGVRDYVIDNVNGFVTASDPLSLRSALNRVMADDRDPEVECVAAVGRIDVRSHHDDYAYRRRLLKIVDQFLERERG